MHTDEKGGGIVRYIFFKVGYQYSGMFSPRKLLISEPSTKYIVI